MQRKTHIVIASIIFVLGGCGSFNNSFNTYPPPIPKESPMEMSSVVMEPDEDVTAPAIIPIKIAPKATENVSKPCSVSPYPTPGKFPELPIKAAQGAEGDPYALERIWRKHVDELRSYISERRRLQREARETFTEKCETVGK